MITDIGDDFVDYALLEDVMQAYMARVFDEFGIDSEEEDRHLSELSRRMAALDDKETYIVVKILTENHWETFKNSIKYLKEGMKI